MLEKLLPILRNKLKLKPKLNTDPSIPSETDANLLPEAEYVAIIEKSFKRNVSIYQATIVFLSLFFAFFLFINNILDFYLVRLKNVQKSLVLTHNSMIRVESEYNDLVNKLSFYKEASNKKYIGEKVDFVVSNISDPVIPTEYEVNRDRFTITVRSPKTTYVTGVILKYLSKDMIKEIVIKKADLDTEHEGYLIELEGTFTTK